MTTEATQDVATPLSAEGAGRALEVPGSTVKLWLSTFEVAGARKNSRGWQIDQEGLAILEAIKELRDAGAGNETIRRRLPSVEEASLPSPTVDSDRQSAPVAAAEAPEVPSEAPTVPVAVAPVVDERQLATTVTDAVTRAVAQQTELAERYARVAHRVGELEAKLGSRDEALADERGRREEAERRVAALEAELAAERQRLSAAVGAMVNEQQRLSAAVEAANNAKKPRWKFWG